MIDDTNLITTHQVADICDMKYRHIWTYLKRGVMPTPKMYIGNKPLWDKPTIEEWAATRSRHRRKESI